MILEIKIPSPGESITEVEIARWLVEDGDFVSKDQELAEIESDKATLPLLAEKEGKIKILLPLGLIKVGTVACTIDTSVSGSSGSNGSGSGSISCGGEMGTIAKQSEKIEIAEAIKPAVVAATNKLAREEPAKIKITPLAQKLIDESGSSVEEIINGLKKITTKEVKMALNSTPHVISDKQTFGREVNREKMSQLRRKISERLVAVKNQTAMLTTFNEIDMSAVLELRNKYQKIFQEKFAVKLGLMSFFAKAVSIALKEYQKINSFIEGDEIVSPGYVDIAIAVQTDKGLMVPVIRNVESLSLAQIESEIDAMAKKARSFRLSPDEMSGGTFTITNGGVFGSLLSTPIVNPPQSGILGMHNIVDRPVALNGQVVIRPMMYVALSYDHRIVDGKDSVSFLVRVKELLESPLKMLVDIPNPDKALLGL